MKPDERELLVAVADRGLAEGIGEFPREIAQTLGMNWKRANYLFEKWTRRGWYDYGTNVDLGWLTDAGRKVAAP